MELHDSISDRPRTDAPAGKEGKTQPIPDCWHSAAGFLLTTGGGVTRIRDVNGVDLVALINDPLTGFRVVTELPVVVGSRHPTDVVLVERREMDTHTSSGIPHNLVFACELVPGLVVEEYGNVMSAGPSSRHREDRDAVEVLFGSGRTYTFAADHEFREVR